MIRVIYRWSVDPERGGEFAAAWREVTRCIQQGCPDARGSVVLKSQIDANVYLAVARWDGIDAWRDSREAEDIVPAPLVERMRAAAGGPAGYEIFDELPDWALH
ncbi:antibiotic biosynthesis monooxygenase family protein [Massilia litorea]|uniref:Antibiotic biosynthesis monooxygenase n=1 Tax=Massilia litorea TaxID=2769491 RepID=A0A7L9U8I5_9BURK|nr:antibiotic biosynthesis monooxygenase [Massilia litorea]QOL50406.1 antibiotic biosynthesis monooxygenase [Massilia litorea]